MKFAKYLGKIVLSRYWFFIVLPFLSVLGLSSQAQAQMQVVTLDDKRAQMDHDMPFSLAIHMPFISSRAYPGAAMRINEMLFSQILGIWPDITLQGTKIILTRLPIVGQTTIENFSILRNDDKIFSLIVAGSYCGAYCSDTNFRFSFDAKTGRLLLPGDLVDAQGLLDMRQTIHMNDQRRVHTALQSLQPRTEEYTNELASYRDCLKRIQDTHVLRDMMIDHTNMIFERTGLCDFPHVISAWDLASENAFPFNRLSAHLTPYGRSALLGRTPIMPVPPAIFQGPHTMFHGLIGKHSRILLLLDTQSAAKGEHDIYGLYAYRAVGVFIDLTGTMIANQLHLFEENGVIDATLRDGTLRGTWHRAQQTLPFFASLD